MRTSVLLSVLTAALVVGIAACKGPDSLDVNYNNFTYVARGANVLPAATDTLARGAGTITTDITANTVTWAYATTTAPTAGTIDSIVIYQTGAGTNPLPAATTATVVLCSTAATCATGGGTVTPLGAATATTVRTSMRAYGSQISVHTTTSGHAGAMRGTVYPVGS